MSWPQVRMYVDNEGISHEVKEAYFAGTSSGRDITKIVMRCNAFARHHRPHRFGNIDAIVDGDDVTCVWCAANNIQAWKDLTPGFNVS